MSSTVPVVVCPRQSVIVLQSSHEDVIDLANCLNDMHRTAMETWMHVAYLQIAEELVVEELRAATTRSPDQLAMATQVLNAIMFIHRHKELYGPEVFPKIRVVDIFND